MTDAPDDPFVEPAPPKGIDDALNAGLEPARISGRDADAHLAKLLESAGVDPEPELPEGVALAHFHAYMPEHKYLFAPTGDLWPGPSVNSRIPPVTEEDGGGHKPILATVWLDRNQAVEQMTWCPGEPMLIRGRLVNEGGWLEHKGCTTFNSYRPAVCQEGNQKDIGIWWTHLVNIYGEASAQHILCWLACRVQHPELKINHALVLGGGQGIGKDTLLEPVKYAVGRWNFHEVSPIQLLGRFNGFLRSVILRVSEARDLGEIDRYSFYEHTKTYTAAPPDVLTCNEKHKKEYCVFNVTGVIMTTNHRTDGLYLPADDRRHYVAWSEAVKEDFPPAYWACFWDWYAKGGLQNVASYLRTVGYTGFDPKAPPPRTEAFRMVVDAHRPTEESELYDAIELLGFPDVVSKEQIATYELTPIALKEWLLDRKNARQFGRRMEGISYVAVRNDRQGDGRWKLNGRNVTLFQKASLSRADAVAKANELCEGRRAEE